MRIARPSIIFRRPPDPSSPAVIEIVPDAFPLVAHTVNDYRRLAPGSWAPKTMSWAPGSYAAAVRTAAETEETTRLEFRLPGADCNVFLALAVMLGAGLTGSSANFRLDGRADHNRRAIGNSRQAFRAFPPISSKPRGASGPAKRRGGFSATALSITSRPCAKRKMRPCAGPSVPRKSNDISSPAERGESQRLTKLS